MTSKQQLIDDIESQARQFKQLVSDVDEQGFEEKRIDGRWGYREVVSHLTGWQGQLAAGLKQAAANGGGAGPSDFGAQPAMRWNDTFAEHAKGKRQEQVLQEFDDGVRTFVNAAREAPEDLFDSGAIGERLATEDLQRFSQHIDMVKGAQGG